MFVLVCHLLNNIGFLVLFLYLTQFVNLRAARANMQPDGSLCMKVYPKKINFQKILLDHRVAEPMSVQQNAPHTPTPSMVSGASGASGESTGPPPRKKEKRQRQREVMAAGPEIVIHREEEEEGKSGWGFDNFDNYSVKYKLMQQVVKKFLLYYM